MKILNYCLVGCTLLGLANCHRAVLPTPASAPVVDVIKPAMAADTIVSVPDLVHIPVFEMSKTPCFGSCPVFIVKIFANGIVQWEGSKNVARLGKYTAQAPAHWIADILGMAEDQGFYKMAHRYPSNGTTVPDLPQTTITICSHERGRYSVTNIADAPLSLLGFQRDFEEKLEALVWKSVQ